MTTRFNKDMYAKMRSKKDEPLANIGKRVVRITGKGPSIPSVTDATPIVSGVENVRTASPATSIKEIPTPSSKRQRVSGKEKEKEKMGSFIWDDEGVAVERAHGVVNAEDLKVFSRVPLNVVASQHVHRIVQVKTLLHSLCSPYMFFFFTNGLSFLHQVLGESLYLASECLTQEAKVASLASRMEALEKENSTLKKKLIDSMDEATTLRENIKALNADLRVECQLNLEKDDQLQVAKEKLKTIAARSVEAF